MLGENYSGTLDSDCLVKESFLLLSRLIDNKYSVMLQKIFLLLFAIFIVAVSPSCNANKIPCPTYADSFPDKKAKKGKQKPDIPKASKPKSGLLPPNAIKRK
jgi:hypothetical protein